MFRKKRKVLKKNEVREGFNVKQYQTILEAFAFHELVGDPVQNFKFRIREAELDPFALERLECQGFYYDDTAQAVCHK